MIIEQPCIINNNSLYVRRKILRSLFATFSALLFIRGMAVLFVRFVIIHAARLEWEGNEARYCVCHFIICQNIIATSIKEISRKRDERFYKQY